MILPMVRVEMIGPRGRFPAALEFLQKRAALELRDPLGGGVAPMPAAPEADAAGVDARLEGHLRRIDALSARLAPARGGRPEPLPDPATEAFSARLAALEGSLSDLEARRAALVAEREATRQFGQLVVAVAPLGHGLDPALEPEVHALLLRGDGAVVALLEDEVRRLTGGACEVRSRRLDADTTGVLVVVPRAAGPALAALLAERQVAEARLPSRYAGKSLVDVLFLLAARERSLPAEIARADAEIAALAASAGPSLAAARVGVARRLERHRAIARCGGTHGAFVVAGYMPAERVEPLRADAAAELGKAIAVAVHEPAPAEWGDVPVVLRNRPSVRPFERLLALVPLPRYGSVDATPWLAVFFPLFFGLVLGDVAFGLLGIAAALVVRLTGWRGQLGRDVAWIALWCSISAVVFGLLFGEALGEL